jgi:DNA-binding GntR family transcriptional regulator
VPVPDKADPRPVYQQIAADLSTRIAAGEFAPSGQLPPNTALAAGYGVSQETVRKALRELTDQGIIAAHSTIGTFVLKMPGEPGPSSEFVSVMKRLDEMEDDVRQLRETVEALKAERDPAPGS